MKTTSEASPAPEVKSTACRRKNAASPKRIVPQLSSTVLRGIRGSAIIAMSLALGGCAGYVPGRQTYWDQQVREMCEKDGGVTVYDRVRISKRDINRRVLPMTTGGRLSFAPQNRAHPDAPIYGVERITTLRERNPQVWRTENAVIRRGDQATVARTVIYARAGGDIPTGIAEGSSFICPDPNKIASELHNQLFIVEGD